MSIHTTPGAPKYACFSVSIRASVFQITCLDAGRMCCYFREILVFTHVSWRLIHDQIFCVSHLFGVHCLHHLHGIINESCRECKECAQIHDVYRTDPDSSPMAPGSVVIFFVLH